MVRLFQEFVAEVDHVAMQRISGELQRMMTGMADSATRTGDRASAFGEQLTDLTTALQTNDAPALTSQVAAALVGTAQMKSLALELHEQVLASRQEIERLQADLVRTRDEAALDPLTRVLNRKGFDQQLAFLLEQPLASDSAHLSDHAGYRSFQEGERHARPRDGRPCHPGAG